MVSGQQKTSGAKSAEHASAGWRARVARQVLGSTRRFAGCVGGQFAMVAAILLPVLAGITGGAMDLYIHQFQITSLQNSADSAVLAAVREASLKGWNSKTAKAVADNYLASLLASTGMNRASYQSFVTVDAAKRRVTVAVEQDDYGYFFLGYFKGSPQIRVSATAQASGSTNICVIGLETTGIGTVNLIGKSKISASECAVYSNSGDPHGLGSVESAYLKAKLACSAGGYAGAKRNFSLDPITDCPPIPDPLAHRLPPTFSTSCKYKKLSIKKNKAKNTLSPGVYCDGLTIMQKAEVTMSPGIYVFKNGPLVLNQDAVLKGDGVGFYFTGPEARLDAKGGSIMDLSAPKTGPLAGLLMFQDRKNSVAEFVIKSKRAANLLGTIYLPNGDLIVKTINPIAENSAYTAIVARRLSVEQSADLVLNTNYDGTDVPVPDGIGPQSGKPRLVQ